MMGVIATAAQSYTDTKEFLTKLFIKFMKI